MGAVRELGQITSTPTPHTDALLGLVRLMAPHPRRAVLIL